MKTLDSFKNNEIENLEEVKGGNFYLGNIQGRLTINYFLKWATNPTAYNAWAFQSVASGNYLVPASSRLNPVDYGTNIIIPAMPR